MKLLFLVMLILKPGWLCKVLRVGHLCIALMKIINSIIAIKDKMPVKGIAPARPGRATHDVEHQARDRIIPRRWLSQFAALTLFQR